MNGGYGLHLRYKFLIVNFLLFIFSISVFDVSSSNYNWLVFHCYWGIPLQWYWTFMFLNWKLSFPHTWLLVCVSARGCFALSVAFYMSLVWYTSLCHCTKTIKKKMRKDLNQKLQMISNWIFVDMLGSLMLERDSRVSPRTKFVLSIYQMAQLFLLIWLTF